jgi:hypothetical protein
LLMDYGCPYRLYNRLRNKLNYFVSDYDVRIFVPASSSKPADYELW